MSSREVCSRLSCRRKPRDKLKLRLRPRRRVKGKVREAGECSLDKDKGRVRGCSNLPGKGKRRACKCQIRCKGRVRAAVTAANNLRRYPKANTQPKRNPPTRYITPHSARVNLRISKPKLRRP